MKTIGLSISMSVPGAPETLRTTVPSSPCSRTLPWAGSILRPRSLMSLWTMMSLSGPRTPIDLMSGLVFLIWNTM